MRLAVDEPGAVLKYVQSVSNCTVSHTLSPGRWKRVCVLSVRVGDVKPLKPFGQGRCSRRKYAFKDLRTPPAEHGFEIRRNDRVC